MQQPVQQVSPSIAQGQVTDEILESFMQKSRLARASETGNFRFFGPAFQGDYGDMDVTAKVLGFCQIWAAELRQSFGPTKADFDQFLSVLSKAANPVKALEVWKVAKSAYKTAEARTLAQISILQALATNNGSPTLFDDFADDCVLNWEAAEKFESEMVERAIKVETAKFTVQDIAAAIRGKAAVEAVKEREATVEEGAAGESEGSDSSASEDVESGAADESGTTGRGSLES